MAFSSKVFGVAPVIGTGKKKAWGSWTSDSTTGGDVVVPLINVESFVPVAKGSAVTANGVVVNETLPLKNGATATSVTIVTDSGVDGYWEAIGI